MGYSTVCSILKETCKAIWSALVKDYVKAPISVKEWEGVSSQFEKKIGISHTVLVSSIKKYIYT